MSNFISQLKLIIQIIRIFATFFLFFYYSLSILRKQKKKTKINVLEFLYQIKKEKQ